MKVLLTHWSITGNASKKETQSPFSIKLQARGLQLYQEKQK